MSKAQFGIAILAVTCSILLYLLPKGIIKREKEMPVQARPVEKAMAPPEAHNVKPGDAQQKSIGFWRKEFYSVSNKEKKIKFADSLAAIFRKFHQYDSAARYAEEVALLDPTQVNEENAGDAYNMAYTAADESEKPFLNEKSRRFYSKVLEKTPGNLEVKSKLALTYIGTDNPMQGISMLREILKSDPKNESAIYNLGILSMQSGQYQKAIERFKQLIEINPSNANAHFYLGMSFMNSGEKKKAKIAFEAARALENDPAFQATVETYLKELEQESGTEH